MLLDQGAFIQPMDYQKVSNTDLYISRITLGCRSFTGSDIEGIQDEEDSIGSVLTALDIGINSFDTAPQFGGGRSEEILGKALVGRREEAFIFSKLDDSVRTIDELVESCAQSLKRLRTDRIDFLSVGIDQAFMSPSELRVGLEVLKSRGMVRYYGFDRCEESQFVDLKNELDDLSFVQVPYSLLDRRVESGTLSRCIDSDITAFAYAPYQHGLLDGQFRSENQAGFNDRMVVKGVSDLAFDNDGLDDSEVFDLIDKIWAISMESGIRMSQLALGWVLNQKGIGSVVVGARKPHQILDSVSVLDQRFSPSLMARLDEASFSTAGLHFAKTELLEAIAQ